MKLFICLLCISLFSSCQTAPSKKTDATSEAVAALGTVTEGLTNQGISQEELKRLALQVQKDPQTKSAVQSINEALNAHQVGVKYCPVDGQRFDMAVEQCPIHKIKLKVVE